MNSLCLVDTNILVYSVHLNSLYHTQAKRFLEEQLPLRTLAVTLQNLTEFFAITTNKKYLPSALSTSEAIKNMEIFTSSCSLLLPTQHTRSTLFSLLSKSNVSGQNVHDIHLAALMLDNNVSTIYTLDVEVFKRVGLTAINPL